MNSEDLEIDRQTTIRQLLDIKQDEVINALVTLNKNFAKLKNPVLRKLLARRVNVADACKIAGCKVSDFFRTMQEIGFKLKGEKEEGRDVSPVKFVLPSDDQIISFDVRPVLEQNRDPLKEIMEKIRLLKEGQALKLINSFEPVPLIHLLKKKGFNAYSEQQGEKLVITYFYQVNELAQSYEPELQDHLSGFEEILYGRSGKLKMIDVSGMEMPQPMHTILDELASLHPEDALFVRHKKVPVYLLPHLHDQGYDYIIREDGPLKISLLIYKS